MPASTYVMFTPDGAAGGQRMVSIILADPVAKHRGAGRVSIGQSSKPCSMSKSETGSQAYFSYSGAGLLACLL